MKNELILPMPSKLRRRPIQKEKTIASCRRTDINMALIMGKAPPSREVHNVRIHILDGCKEGDTHSPLHGVGLLRNLALESRNPILVMTSLFFQLLFLSIP